MKHEAEQQLLKTLNGQLSELPSFTSAMVAITGGAFSLTMLGCLSVNIIHACAPIASLISDLLN